ncbi:MAG: GNAT family N-acetyltransferase [Bdellovibrionota bacterium]
MLETPRLVIQPWKESDTLNFFELTQDAGFRSFPITDWRQPSVEAARSWIQTMELQVLTTKFGAFAIRTKPDLQVIGMAAIRILNLETENRPEITYRLRESAWGHGYATEAARAMLEYGFGSLSLEQIAVSSETLLGKVAEIYRIRRADFEHG